MLSHWPGPELSRARWPRKNGRRRRASSTICGPSFVETILDRDNPASRNARFSHAAIARLVAGSCAGFVISPGSRHTPLVMAAAHAGVRTEVVLDERSAGFLALGWAKAAQAPVALMCTSGTAGAHYLPAVIEAWETGVPLVLITTDRPPEHLGIGAPQTTRQDGFFAHHVKGQCIIGAADDASAMGDLEGVDELLVLARAGKPGPVQINIGFREPLWEATPTPLTLQDTMSPTATIDPEPDPVIRFPDAPQGILAVGPVQESRPDAAAAVQALVALARDRGWPVLADIASGLRQHAPPASTLVHGSDLFLRSEAARAALRPQLVLHVGRMPTSKTLFTWLQQLEDDNVEVVHLSTDGQAHSLGHSPRVVATNWQQLRVSCRAAASTGRGNGDWMRRWQDAQRLTHSAIDDAATDAGLWEGTVARVASRMPAGSSLVLGSGMPIRDADTYVTRLAPDTNCLVNRGVNGIDGLLATAAGVATQDAARP
ncbi:MAG: 2-succinyl-5-enolpyruvyl-6-hydroxy-3-cyclohexene-1-carboxylic-acid synthase, partial [Chromatiales bacterium]